MRCGRGSGMFGIRQRSRRPAWVAASVADIHAVVGRFFRDRARRARGSRAGPPPVMRTNSGLRAHLVDVARSPCSPSQHAGRPSAAARSRTDAALVRHAAFDALGHQLLDARLGRPGSSGRRSPGLRHRAERAHAAIRLVRAALVELDLARRLLRCRRTGRRSSSQCAPATMRLGDVARVANAAVGDQRDAGVLAAPRRPRRSAVICGTPTPATMRVVQIEPGPMPTLTPSAPASTSAFAAVGGGDVAADDLRLREVLA